MGEHENGLYLFLLNTITFSKLDLEDSMETLVEEVQLHDSQITKLNSNDAVQDEKISALETALYGIVA